MELDAAVNRTTLTPKLTVYLSAAGADGSNTDDIKTQTHTQTIAFKQWYFIEAIVTAYFLQINIDGVGTPLT